MSTLKAALKAAKAAIHEKNFSTALYNAELALRHDPDNYHARIFMGLAYFNQENYQESEKWYLEAIDKNREEMLAYQGLLSLYEARNHVQGLMKTWDKLRDIYKRNGDACKYEEYTNLLVEKSIEIGDDEKASGLLNELLKTNNNDNQQILSRILDIEEKIFAKEVSNEVQKRRFRIGAPNVHQLQTQVESELIMKRPALEYYYDQLMELIKDDEDEKNKVACRYFFYLLMKLLVVDIDRGKKELRQVLDSLADQIKSNDPRVLEYRYERVDIFSLDEIDELFLRYPYTDCPGDYSKLLDLVRQRTTEDLEQSLTFLEDFLKTRNSRLAFFIQIYFMQKAEDILGIANLTNEAISALTKRSLEEALPVSQSILQLKLISADCLLKFGGVENLMKSETLFEQVLANKPGNLDTIVGLSKVYLKQSLIEKATKFLLTFNNDETIKEQSLYLYALGNCYFQQGRLNEALDLFHLCDQKQSNPPLNTAMMIGKTYWELGGEFRSDKKFAHTKLLLAAKQNPNADEPFEYLGQLYQLVAGDLERAQKCFRKALENNVNNFDAAKKLFDLLQELSRTDEASEIAHLMADSAETNPKCPWASLFLGSFYREGDSQDYLKSIFYIQLSLKSDRNNPMAWILLGDSYEKQGRFVSAIKAFAKTKTLVGDFDIRMGFILYRLGQLRSLICMFDQSIFDLTKSLNIIKCANQSAIPVVCSLLETLGCFAKDRFNEGYFGECFLLCDRMIDLFIEYYPESVTNSEYRCILYKRGYDALTQLLEIPKHLETKFHWSKFERASEVIKLEMKEMKNKRLAALSLALHFISEAVSLFPSEPFLIYEHIRCILLYSSNHSEMVKECWKAISLDPQSSIYWNCLGKVCMKSDALLSQHAFIKAIELKTCNIAIPWTNLGFLYLRNHDSNLACECFSQAQAADPEWYQSWVGQSLAENESINMFPPKNLVHAQSLYSLDDKLNSLLAELTCRQLAVEDAEIRLIDNVRFGLIKSQELGKLDDCSLNYLGIILEYSGYMLDAVKAYSEASDSDVSRLNLSRSLLQAEKYRESIHAFSQISTPVHINIISMTIQALALYFSGDLQLSISTFEKVQQMLYSSSDSSTSVEFIKLSLAKVLCALETEESIELAKNHLLAFHESNPHFLPALTTLLALGIKYESQEICDIVIAQVKSNFSQETSNSDDYRGFLIALSYHDFWVKGRSAALSTLSRRLHLTPNDGRLLAELKLLIDQAFPLLQNNYSTLLEISDHADFSSWNSTIVACQRETILYPSNVWTRLRLFDALIHSPKVDSIHLYDQITSYLTFGSLEHQCTAKILLASLIVNRPDDNWSRALIVPLIHQTDEAVQQCSLWRTKRAGYLILAKLLSKVGMVSEQIETLRHCSELFPKSWPVIRDFSLALNANENTSLAIENLKRFVESCCSDVKTASCILLAYLSLESGNLEAASFGVNNALKQDGKNEVARLLQAKLLITTGNKSKALKILSNLSHPLKDTIE